MTHRVPDEPIAWSEEEKPKSRSPFREKFLPHISIAAVTLLYVAFYIFTGINSHNFTGAAVPQTISVAWTGALATWIGYCIRERTTKGEK